MSKPRWRVSRLSSGVALVTGASRGIGRAIAVRLAADDLAVGVNFLSDAEAAKETAATIEAMGGETVCVQADVGDPGEVDRCFSEVEDALGPVTVLVNNAGIRRDGLALTLADDAWHEVIRTNLFGTFACCRRALKTMLRARAGRIVNVSSIAGLRASPGQVSYSAAKAGVLGLTRTLAREVGHKGIRVNAVAPGLIATDLTSDLGPDRLDVLTSEIPQRRAGTPEEVAGLVSFLCSDDAGYVNGSVFVMDGGLVA